MSQPGTSKSKDLKISTKQVINRSALKEDLRKGQLLHIVRIVQPISEAALQTLIYELQQKGLDMKYAFMSIQAPVARRTFQNRPRRREQEEGTETQEPQERTLITSKDLKEDITALLYLGLIENSPSDKRFRLTADGEQALGEVPQDQQFLEKVTAVYREVEDKLRAIDREENRWIRKDRRMRRR